MKILKRTTAILFIFLFLLTPVGLNMACPVPTYAADEWEDVTKADLVTAFKYYCKSRNLAVEGSLADALTTFTTNTFNNLVNTLGIDSDAIQAELKKTTQGNLGLRFLFTQTGVNFYNRIFAEFLQNNDLSVGDDVDNKTIYSGKYYTDSDGHSCMVFVITGYNSYGGANNDDFVLQHGSYYKYSPADIKQLFDNGTTSLSFVNASSFSVRKSSSSTYGGEYLNIYFRNYVPVSKYGNNVNYINGFPIICTTDFTQFRLGVYSKTYDVTSKSFKYWLSVNNSAISDEDRTVEDANIYITTNNNTINNNDYSKDYTIIYNEGDYYDIDHNYPSPDTPPDGGGGGGGDNPDTPTPPTPPSSTPPDWPIELPDTDIDWIIRGMEERFPWDIPFNVMFALSLLNAEPETPHFEGTIDLKVVQWNYDIDLEPFDQIAEYFRKFFFFGFIVWLLLVTKKLIWG